MQTAYIYDDVLRCASHLTGKERDSETGLDYFGARYYGSNMGRWMSPDWSASAEPVPYAELSDPQTLNLYGYVRNNPLYKADADGHDWNDSLDFLGGVVKGVASSMTGGYIGAPSANDSAASLSGQLVGTGMVATTGTSMVSSSGPTAVAGLVAAPETGGASLVVTGGAAVEALAGAGMQVGAAKNAGAVISAMASKGEGGTSRRPNSDVKKQADEAATGADGKQRCAYCGKELTNETGKPNSKEYDHVKPYSQGGDSSSGNIKDACRTCNRQKGARTPEEWKGQQ